MKRYGIEFLELTDVKNIIEHIKINGLDSLSTYDVNSISDDEVRVFFDTILEFVTDYVQNENPENYTRARTDLFKKRYDKFLMCYDVLHQNDLVTEELKELKENYDRVMINKLAKLIKEAKKISDDPYEKQIKLDAVERIMETINLSSQIVKIDGDENKRLFSVSAEEFKKIKNGAIRQKQDDEKKLEDTAVALDVDAEPKKDDNQPIVPPMDTNHISLDNVSPQVVDKKSRLDKRLESLKIQLIPEEEIQKLKQKTEVLFESIAKANKEGNNPQLVNELYAEYKESKADLEFAIDNNQKVNKKIARLEGAKKIASIPRKQFNKIKENAKLKASEVKKQIHEKMDPIVESAKAKADSAKDFVVDKAKAAANFVTEKKDDLTDRIVTGYNNVGNEIQNKLDAYSAEVKSQEQLSSDAISEALAHMGNETSIEEIDNAVEKINKVAAKDSKKAERKVVLYGTLQKLHSIPKALKDAIKQKVKLSNEQQVSTGRAM